MIKKLKRFLPDIAGAAGGSPVEIFVILLFSVYAVLMVEGVADGDRGYLALYPLSLSLSFLFNLWFRGKRLRFIYFLSALLPLSMAGCDLSGFVDSVAYPVSLMAETPTDRGEFPDRGVPAGRGESAVKVLSEAMAFTENTAMHATNDIINLFLIPLTSILSNILTKIIFFRHGDSYFHYLCPDKQICV